MKTNLLSVIRGEYRTAKLSLAQKMESKIVSCQNRAGKMTVTGSLLGIMMSQHRSAHRTEGLSGAESPTATLLPEIIELPEGTYTPPFLESTIAQSHRLKRASA